MSDCQFKTKIKKVLYSKGYYKIDDYLEENDIRSTVDPTQHNGLEITTMTVYQ